MKTQTNIFQEAWLDMMNPFNFNSYKSEKIKDIKVKMGDKLDHRRFGNGIVTSIINHEIVEVDFGSFKKNLLKNFAGFK